MMSGCHLISLLAVVLLSSAPSFTAYSGLHLRGPVPTGKAFAQKWVAMKGESASALRFASRQAAPPLYGATVDRAIIVVSKRLHSVVGFAFAFSFAQCTTIEKAFDQRFGKATVGAERALQWQSPQLEATLEHEGPEACVLIVSDRGWDEEADRFKKS